MRFRKKAWAIPEMSESPLCCMDAEERVSHWQDWFEKPSQPLALELGCGKGRFLYEAAKAEPDINFIGVDIEANAMINAKREIEAAGLGNARLLRHDISQIEGIFDRESVERLYIHFPNPWPKKRHYKRRLTHPRQLLQYHSFMKAGAPLFFKTDDTELYEMSLNYLPRFGFEIIKSSADLAPEDDPTGIMTEYEERWRGQGMAIKAIMARRLPVHPADYAEELRIFTAEEKAERNHPEN